MSVERSKADMVSEDEVNQPIRNRPLLTWALGIALFLILSLATFGTIWGSLVYALEITLLFRPRIHSAIFWSAFILGPLTAVLSVTLLNRTLFQKQMSAHLRWVLGLNISIFGAILIGGVIATTWRSIEVKRFNPDQYIAAPFVMSIQETPKDFQFFLHAAALKNCKPYIWSYSRMQFVPVRANIAVNILPNDWLRECQIERTRR